MQFEGLLQNFLNEAGCSAEEFVGAAKQADGMNEIYLRIFLAHVSHTTADSMRETAYAIQCIVIANMCTRSGLQTEYELFVELMSHEASKQKEWSDGMAKLKIHDT